MDYIATFYSHFGAIRFKKLCEAAGWKARLMPVPRFLSSSCGTCVSFSGDAFCPAAEVPDEVEQIARIDGEKYVICFRAENS